MLETLQEILKKTNERKIKIATRKENRKRREFQTQIKNITTAELWTWLRQRKLEEKNGIVVVCNKCIKTQYIQAKTQKNKYRKRNEMLSNQ